MCCGCTPAVDQLNEGLTSQYDWLSSCTLRSRVSKAHSIEVHEGCSGCAEQHARAVPSMNTFVEFILKHGYSVLFAAMFAHQIGFPIPGPFLLLAAGALVVSGKLNFGVCLVLSLTACVLADWIWYEAGRTNGEKVLHFLHRLAPDPDAADRKARERFAKFGLSILLIAKFVPGVDAVAPPLAGTSGTSRSRFLMFDALGATLYCAVYTGLGCIFSHDLDRAAAFIGRAGTLLGAVAGALFVVYAARKLVRSHRVLGEPRFARITPVDDAT